MNTCDLWSRMISSERYQLLVQTLVLGTPGSYLRQPTQHYRKNGSDSCGGDPDCDNGCNIDRTPLTCGLDICHSVSGPDCAASCACDIVLIRDNFETLLDRATSLYSVNGPREPGSADGTEYDRIYLGFDAEATMVMRNSLFGWGSWVDSNDPAGPHPPFNQREDIRWGFSIFTGNNGPTRHHWSNDGYRVSLCSRLGVGLVTDPSVVEVTTSYNWLHDSNPALTYGGRFGYQIAEDHLGPGQYDWMPSGCPWTPPAPDAAYGHWGLGPPGCL
jgi:hypothetical protein